MKKALTRLIVIALLIVGITSVILVISSSRSFQFFGEIVDRVETQEKVVALTFDDGPTNKTDEILEILEKVDIRATFFLTGNELESNIEEGIKIVTAGHEIGNHSFSHSRMIFKSPSFIRDEIVRTDELIEQAGFEGEIFFRPPYGRKLLILPYVLKQSDKKTIMWSIEPDSCPEIASDASRIVNHVVEEIEPGAIILLHVMYENRKEELNSIEGIVNALKEKGYRFKTMSELLKY